MPLVSMPPELKADLLKGVPNLLEDPPVIITPCGACGCEESSHRYAPGENLELTRVEECLQCGAEKTRRVMTPGR